MQRVWDAMPWTMLLAIFFATQSYFTRRFGGRPPGPFWRHLAYWGQGGLTWAFFFPAIWLAAERWPLMDVRGEGFDSRARMRRLSYHVGIMLAINTVAGSVDKLVSFVDIGPRAPWWVLVSSGLFSTATEYAIVATLAHATLYARLYAERRAREATLASELRSARLSALQAQLRPHFLFNTLNAMAELVHDAPDRAEAIITDLGTLLRRSFAGDERQEVPLTEELAGLEPYLGILAHRFDDRVRVTVEVEPGLGDAMVPAWSLQPLVENAVRHGIEPKPGGGAVAVRVTHAGNQLVLAVADDGLGLRGMTGEGIGLGATRARLAHLHPGQHALTLQTNAAGGVTATMSFPLRRAEQA